MGCFSATCILSSLPIEWQTPVRFIALARDPLRGTGFICSVNDVWAPITPAIKGVYNDYGSIEKLEEGPVTQGFFRVLNERAIERGVGENSIHDVAVVRGMSREDWLMALWEGRVQVRDDFMLSYVVDMYSKVDALERLPWKIRCDVWLRKLKALYGRLRPQPKGPPMQVAQALIREDVWQFFLARARKDFPTLGQTIHGRELERAQRLMNPSLSLPEEVANEIHGALSEVVHVQAIMNRLRKIWMEGTTAGPQEGEWSRHLEYHSAMARIARSEVTAQKERC